MKNNLNYILLILITFTYNFTFSQACAGNMVEGSLRNIKVGCNYFEYDIYLKNTSSNTINLGGVTTNILYDAGLFPAGSTLTLSVVDQPNGPNCPFTTLNTISNYVHDATNRQLRSTQTPVSPSSGLQVNMPSNTDMKFVRFRVQCSEPLALTSFNLRFPTNADPIAITKVQLSVGCNGNSNSTVLALSNSTLILGGPYNQGLNTTIWDGTSWSNGLPVNGYKTIFNASYNSNGTTPVLNACTCEVNNNSIVTINNGHTLNVTKEINLSPGSTMIVENNGAIVQNKSITNSGNYIVKRNSAPMIRLDYTAWSSPVSGQNLLNFSPNTLTNRFYTYNPVTNSYTSIIPNSTNFDSGIGYLIRVANDWSPSVYTNFIGVFSGLLNNGDVDKTVNIGYNLVGNPYASPINASTFLTNNPNVTALYFWTHTIPAIAGVFPSNNYASFTNLGGAAAAAAGAVPNGFIQSGQGFFVNITSAGNISFKNTQRMPASSSSQFFKNLQTSNSNEIEKHRFWLNLNGENALHNQILIGYMNGASNQFDNGIDGMLLNDSESVIYSLIENDKYVIQGKGLPFSNSDIVLLGIKINTPGNYTINLENRDGLFETQVIYLKDNLLNSIQELTSSGYVFYSDSGTFNDRFEIVYQSTLLTNNTFTSNDNEVNVYNNASGIHISTSNKENIQEVIVYDLTGKRIYYKEFINKSNYNFQLDKNMEVVLMKVKTVNNKTILKKINL